MQSRLRDIFNAHGFANTGDETIQKQFIAECLEEMNIRKNVLEDLKNLITILDVQSFAAARGAMAGINHINGSLVAAADHLSTANFSSSLYQNALQSSAKIQKEAQEMFDQLKTFMPN